MRMNGASNMWARSESKHAAVRVEVLGLIARMTIEMTFPAPAGSNWQIGRKSPVGRS